MITRKQLYEDFKQEWNWQPIGLVRVVFNSTSDLELAITYKLKIISRGKFYK